MERFPHLKFLQKVIGKPRLHGGGEPNPLSIQNKNNRQGHFGYLSGRTSQIKSDWEIQIGRREELGLAPLDADIIPIFLKINPDLVTYDFDLKQFGIEVISQEEEGYIIGASLDSFTSLNEKINRFLNEQHGGAKIADFWEIIEGNQWKPEHVLSDYLKSIWSEIIEDRVYKVEIGIAFDKPIGKAPDPNSRYYERSLQRYNEELVERDNRFFERQDEFEVFIGHYGRLTSDIISLEDSFCCEVEITGKGLKDLVFNYPFVFEVSETDEIIGVNSVIDEVGTIDLEVIAPDPTSPEVGVIDSGIMEGHRFIPLL